ncbi:DUF2442 domain-containing protein [Anaeromassilibacillus senegalensis]|uniref:DUF2442 domain-containing protein n=1 Tax=Anaeromassilibacillus senegalensis TaxID=1673717 RepID=UPI000682D5C2|nr:DUF2442 domain-containing protein [Anaeromassilibacillus senegalensis]
MFHKVKTVSALPDYKMLVGFVCGTTKRYDFKPLFDRHPVFRSLCDVPGLFALAKVDAGGYGVCWNDDIDIACDELWANGETVSTPFDGLLAFSDATNMWGLNESTLRKALSYGKLKAGIDAQKYGKQWVITEAAMRREYGDPKAEA